MKTCANYEIFKKTFRYDNKLWKDKAIDSELKRKEGLCPLTPEETALVLSALGLDHTLQIYIAAGEIYGGERRMANLLASFPILVSTGNKNIKSNLLETIHCIIT